MSQPSSKKRARKARAGACPICKKPSIEQFRPFCSRHCADLDLAQWLQGNYAIPAYDQDSQEDVGPVGQLPHGE
jgi:hypothetical protein